MAKFLIIRFSSIGDIVLTSTLIRCLKQQVAGAEVHFITRNSFQSVLQHNPYIDKLWTIEKEIDEILPQLQKENFEEIIDLHHNLRSLRLKQQLKVEAHSFNKLNLEKWLLVQLNINRLPAKHIVDRYLETLAHLGVKNDSKGLDYFISANEKVNMQRLPESHRQGFIAMVIGAKHATKIMPSGKLAKIISLLNLPIVLVGGVEDKEKGEEIVRLAGNLVYNSCGEFKLSESASILDQSQLVISHDTGLMHIAAALKKPIVSLWGNTVPEFGMYPYLPQQKEQSVIMEVKGLSCRPCSKIGYDKCPQKHFKCMNLQQEEIIVAAVKRLLP